MDLVGDEQSAVDELISWKLSNSSSGGGLTRDEVLIMY